MLGYFKISSFNEKPDGKKALEPKTYLVKLCRYVYRTEDHDTKMRYIAYSHWDEAILKEAFKNGINGNCFRLSL